MGKSGITFAEGSFDGVGAAWHWASRDGVADKRGEGFEEWCSRPDQQHLKSEAERSQTVAATGAQPFDQIFRAQLAQVITQLHRGGGAARVEALARKLTQRL